jgi:Fe(3+) dicitrate transport protein
MEDGVLISPAPYSAPAAYYFHSKQNAIFRNIKGGSQIQYGPYTTPEVLSTWFLLKFKTFSGRVTASIGSFTKDLSMVTNIKTMVTY